MTMSAAVDDAKVEEWREKGNGYYKEKNYKKAIDSYTVAIGLNSNMSSLYANRAAAQLMLLQFKQALNDCDSSIALDATVAKVHFRRATALKGCMYHHI